jgi:hypothetical protein
MAWQSTHYVARFASLPQEGLERVVTAPTLPSGGQTYLFASQDSTSVDWVIVREYEDGS